MSVASVVVEIKEGSSDTVLGSLARIPQISVYGVKENQIVTVIEGDTIKDVDATVRQISQLEAVIGVYPVFAGDE